MRLASKEEIQIWERCKRNPRDPGLVLNYGFKSDKPINISDLEMALAALLDSSCHHLRAVFFEHGGLLYKSEQPLPVKIIQTTGESNESIKQGIDHFSGPLFNFELSGTDFIRMRFSHLVFDGRSYDLFVNLLEAAYDGAKLLTGHTTIARNNMERESDAASKQYWQEHLKGAALSTEMPFLFKAESDYTSFISERYLLQNEDSKALLDFCAKNEVTPFQVILTAAGILLAHYEPSSDHKHIPLAYTVDQRISGDSIGCFANLVPIIFNFDQTLTPNELIKFTKATRIATRPHQHLSTKEILLCGDLKLNHSGNLLNVVVNQSPGLFPKKSPHFATTKTVIQESPQLGGPFDLGITFHVSHTDLHWALTCPQERCSREVLAELSRLFLKTLLFMINNSSQPLVDLDFTTDLRPVVQGKITDEKNHKSLVEMAQEHAALYPDQVAVVFGDISLTYRGLMNTMKAIAWKIEHIRYRVDTQAGIGLMLERSEHLPAAMLASLLLNIPFIPLPTDLPSERLSQMIEDSRIKTILIDKKTKSFYEEHFGNIACSILLDSAMSDFKGFEDASKQTSSDASTIAYKIFTSGSTGRPKGVQVSQANLMNFMLAMRVNLNDQLPCYALALTPIGFDISILELLFPLFTGGTVEVLPASLRLAPKELAKKIETSGATLLQATPSTFLMLRDIQWHAKRPLTILCGGERLDGSLAQYLVQEGHLLFNAYGPTEATIWSSLALIRNPKQISIGIPLQNTSYSVVDPKLRSVPIGASGQLIIHGKAVAQGYVIVPKENPFICLNSGPAYCTGDYVRYHGDGQIEYIGRRDSQIKLNGYRIDLREISSCLKKIYPAVTFLPVVRNSPTPHLSCFYFGKESLDTTRSLQQLANYLPSYMVPTSLYRLKIIPLTPNGKSDMKALAFDPLEQLTQDQDDQLASVVEYKFTEDRAMQILHEILLNDLGITVTHQDQPLGNLGLNSLGYAKLAYLLEETFGIKILPHELYAYPTLTDLRGLLGKKATPSARSIKATVDPKTSDDGQCEIAIVGYSALLPQDQGPEKFWSSLVANKSLISLSGLNRGFTKEYHGGFLKNIELFDERFFGISPLEAKKMDPRQRLLLQTCWQTIEDAGYAPQSLARKRIGCFMAATGNDFSCVQTRAGASLNPYSLSGTSLSIIANRISSFFNFTGPSHTIDTACSGSLVSIVNACNSLAAHNCDAALTGGVNLIIDEEVSQSLERGNFLSTNGICAPFDSSASGYIRGEGVGCFLLKRLSDAIADGDAIHGVIKSYTDNHGGKASSLTAPNPQAQRDLLIDAYSLGLAQKVSYIETHGTGTQLGDPIEINALKQAWQALTGSAEPNSVALGAVKSNIGHLEAAAGCASLVKVLLALKYRQIPGNINFRKLNSQITLNDSPFFFPQETTPWTKESPLTAGISSFGFGGSNAHIVVCEAPETVELPPAMGEFLIPLSAMSIYSLTAIIANLANYLASAPSSLRLVDLSYTLCAGRAHLRHRACFIANSLADLHSKLLSNTTGSQGSKYETQCGDYLAGKDLPIRDLFIGQSPKKVRLPTYSFDMRPFWFDETGVKKSQPRERSYVFF